MNVARFEMGQKFSSRKIDGLTAEVVRLLDDGRDAELALRQDGVLLRKQSAKSKFAHFLNYWTLVGIGI